MKDFTRCSTVTQAAESHTLSRTELATTERFGIHDEDRDPPAWPIGHEGIFCDTEGCDRTWVVSVTSTPAEATTFARKHAPGHGWSVTPAGDFCPAHTTRKA